MYNFFKNTQLPVKYDFYSIFLDIEDFFLYNKYAIFRKTDPIVKKKSLPLYMKVQEKEVLLYENDIPAQEAFPC